MKPFLFCLTAVGVGQIVLAQGLPVPQIQGRCPTGTYSSGNSCLATGNTEVYVNGEGSCPQGWTKSAKFYCVRWP